MATKRKCPHAKPVAVVNLQVHKLGAWEVKSNPYGLFVDVFEGGSLQLAQGTKREMLGLRTLAKAVLKGRWEPARLVADLIRCVVPEHLRPR